jgi:hypothetical protein
MICMILYVVSWLSLKRFTLTGGRPTKLAWDPSTMDSQIRANTSTTKANAGWTSERLVCSVKIAAMMRTEQKRSSTVE